MVYLVKTNNKYNIYFKLNFVIKLYFKTSINVEFLVNYNSNYSVITKLIYEFISNFNEFWVLTITYPYYITFSFGDKLLKTSLRITTHKLRTTSKHNTGVLSTVFIRLSHSRGKYDINIYNTTLTVNNNKSFERT
jgi:hypothetical protein